MHESPHSGHSRQYIRDSLKALYIHHTDILDLTGSDGCNKSSVSAYHSHGFSGHGGAYHSTSGIPYLDALYEATPSF